MNIVVLNGIVCNKKLVKGQEKSGVSFTLAVKGYGEHTEFINCVAWSNMAKVIHEYVNNKDRLTVNGSLQVNQTKKGEKTYTNYNVYVREVVLPPKPNEEKKEKELEF